MSPAQLLDAPFAQPQPPAGAPPTPAAAPQLPDAPWVAAAPKTASGPLEAIQAGWQSSAPGLAWRGKLPDLVLDPANSKWWERALSGATQVGAELPLMIGGSIAGTAAGAAAGTAIEPGGGTAIGGLLGGGAGMFAVPTAVRETLMHAYRSGDIQTVGEFFTAMQDVLKKTAESAVVGAATVGAGGIAARTVGRAIAPAVGQAISVPGAIRAIGTADIAAQIATMTTVPPALQGHLPHAQDFVDAAILIGGLHAANAVTAKLMQIYQTTGKLPQQVAAESASDPELKNELVTPAETAPTPSSAEMGPLTESPVYRDVLSQLERVGKGTPAQRADEAALQAAFYRTMAARTGTTPEDLYARRGLTVTGEPLPEGAFGQRAATPTGDATSLDFTTQQPAGPKYTLEHPELRDMLQSMSQNEFGWYQIGGRHQGGPRGVPNFTKWIPNAEWWMNRPDKSMNEGRMREAVRKALAGEDLRPIEQRAVDFLTEVANDRLAAQEQLGRERFQITSEELAKERVEPTTAAIVDTDAVARASERDADAVEAASVRYSSDDAAFMREIRRINGDAETSATTAGRGQAPGEARPAREPGAAPERPAEVVRRTVTGRDPRAGWVDATRISRAGSPLEVYRGAARALSAADFADENLGRASSNGSSGLGVWFTPSKDEAATYGTPEGFLLDIRNPKVIKVDELPGFDTVRDAIAFREQVKAQGHDGIVVTAKHLGGKTHVVAFEPDQVVRSENAAAYLQASPEPFYSMLARRIDEAKMNAGSPQAWKDYVRGLAQKGVKPDEVKWSGLEEWLDLQGPKVSREQVQEFLKQNGVRVEETVLGGKGTPSLADPQIAQAVQDLERLGFPVEQNPEDASQVAFVDTKYSEDIITASEIQQYAREAAAKLEQGKRDGLAPDVIASLDTDAVDLQQAAQAALAVEQHWFGEGRPTDATLSELHAIAVNAGYSARQATDLLDRAMAHDEGAIAELEGMPAASDRLLAPFRAVRPSKFGQYTLPGGENYRELLLTLPEAPRNRLPAGYRVEQMAKGTTSEALNALTNTYQDWLARRGYERISADELMTKLRQERASATEQAEVDQLNKDMIYLRDFEKLWDTAQANQKPRFVMVGPDGSGSVLPGAHDMESATRLAVERANARGLYDNQNFESSHFDQPNILAHVRFNERTDADGKRVLFVEEIQSDWAQRGKSRGFRQPPPAGGPPKMPADARPVRERSAQDMMTADEPAYIAQTEAELGREKESLLNAGVLPEDIIVDYDPTRPQGKGKLYVANYSVQLANGEFMSTESGILRDRYSPEGAMRAARRTLLDERHNFLRGAKDKVPAGPFVQKTEAWVGLTLKRMIRYAAENGFERIAWTTGEQQVQRYTSALRKAVDTIEWTKTEDGVHLVGYKGTKADYTGTQRQRDAIAALDQTIDRIMGERDLAELTPGERGELAAVRDERQRLVDELQSGRVPRGQKVVDTTEHEDALSDAIGKAMADKIRNDPAKSGTIEGADLRIDDTGMGQFYGKIVPNVAKDVLKKLGGGKVTEVEIQSPKAPGGPPQIGAMNRQLEPLRPFDDADAETFAGAESFREQGGRPMIGAARIEINGTPYDVDMIVDRNGVQIVSQQHGFAFGAPRDELVSGRAEVVQWGISSEHAAAYATEAWNNGSLFDALTLLNGDVPAGSEATKQPGIEITPELRAKALEGMPLFQRGGAGPRGYMAPGTRTIGLLAGADASTFIHESGHHFLDLAVELAQEPSAPASLKADIGDALKWLGIGNQDALKVWNGMSLEERRPFHERWAEAFTEYVASGKAPSSALAGAFERFKAWLLDLYQAITRSGEQVSPDVRRIMDRMLATDEEIRQGTPAAYAQEAVDTRARSIVPGVEAGEAAASPFAEKLPQAPGEPSLPGHVNYNRINGTTEVKLAAARLSELYQAKIDAQRRGTVSNEQTSNEAAQLLSDTLGGVDKRLIMPREPGTSAGAAEILARKALTEGALADMMRAGEAFRAKGRGASAEETLDYLATIERTSMIMSEFLGARAEVGRALQILKTTLDQAERAKQIQQLIEAYGGEPTKLAEMMSEIDTPAGAAKFAKETAATSSQAVKLIDEVTNTLAQNASDPAKLERELDALQNRRTARPARDMHRIGVQAVRDVIARNRKNPEKLKAMLEQLKTPEGARAFAEEQLRPTLWDKLVEGWKAGILSGPVTHMANVVGNTSFAFMRPAIDQVAAVIGLARGASVGERLSMWEPVGRMVGLFEGIRDGLKVGVQAMMHEDNDPTKGEQYRHAIEGKKGEIIRLPFRALSAEDRVFSTMNERGELYSMATQEAVKEGLNPLTHEFRERVVQILQNPTVDMMEAAQLAGKRFTFNVPLGAKGRAVQNLVRTWHLEWAVPFIRTPANIALELGRMSPLAPLVGDWSAAFRQGGVARDRAIAELAVGTGIMALTAGYAFSGKISGNGSPQPGERAVKRGAGWQPYSINVDGKWYSYSRIQPVGTLLGLAADMAEIWDHMTPEEQNQIPKMMSVAFANAVTNQTFLQGITMIVNGMSDPTRFMPRMIQQLTASTVPNLIAQPESMRDPYARSINSVLDAVRARLPVQREELPPKIDVWGEPIPSTERVGYVFPSTISEVSKDKVKTEAARLGVAAAGAPKKLHVGRGTGKLGQVEITPQQQEVFDRVAGQTAHQVMEQLVNAPGWDALPDMVKIRMYQHAFAIGHRAGAFASLPPEQRAQVMTDIIAEVNQALSAPGPK